MVVRGETLTTETRLGRHRHRPRARSEIMVPNFHTYGGCGCRAARRESLVVKLAGDNAGFTATGTPLEIDDRIGGTSRSSAARPSGRAHSLADDTVGAGLDPCGQSADSTPTTPTATRPARRLAERQARGIQQRSQRGRRQRARRGLPDVATTSTAIPPTAQFLGNWPPDEKAGDDNLRLGFEVHGFIRLDEPGRRRRLSFDGHGRHRGLARHRPHQPSAWTRSSNWSTPTAPSSPVRQLAPTNSNVAASRTVWP